MSFDNIKLDKGLYTTGKSFNDALEQLDPSENYRGTQLEGLDAFERQLKRFDIKVSGPNSDTISKFFNTTDSAVLFPEYISRAVRYGVQSNAKVDRIVATTTIIDSLDYRSIQSSNTVNQLKLDETNEGTAFQSCEISVKSELTPLKKYGKMIQASYEAIKYQKLDLFSITLKRIGETIANTQFEDALNVACADENLEVLSAAPNFTYTDLVSLWTQLQPYEMNTIVMSADNYAHLASLSEFKDAMAGNNFHGTGKLITPFGADIILSTNGIIALDRNYAIEKVQAGEVMTEFDKLIDRQLERAAVSTIVGFSPIFIDAVKVLPTQE